MPPAAEHRLQSTNVPAAISLGMMHQRGRKPCHNDSWHYMINSTASVGISHAKAQCMIRALPPVHWHVVISFTPSNLLRTTA